MKKRILASFVALSLSYNVTAQSKPGNIKTDSGFIVTPLLSLGLKYDDNIYSQPEGTSASTIMTIDPSINFLLEDGANSYSIDLAAFTGFYEKDTADNYVDGYLALKAHLEQSVRSRLDINANANWVAEPRGTGLTEGQGNAFNEPVRYADQTLEGIYEYGARSALGRVAAQVKYYNKDYLNFTEVTKFRDVEQLLVGGKFIYNTQSGSDAFLELTHEKFDYQVEQINVNSRDSNDVRALVGFAWDVTALTSGSIKLGYQNKDFDIDERGKFDGLSWEANLSWSPLTYTSFDFTTSQAAVDPLTEGNYIEQLIVDIGWNHQWSELMTTRLGFNFMDEEYSGITRSDETLGFTASLEYQILRWINVGVFADISDKDSTSDILIYDKSTFGINVNLSM